MLSDLLFYFGLSLLMAHELDAVKRHEWRIFPGLSNLEDKVAYRLFIVFHLPLFVLIFWLLSSPSQVVRFWFQLSLDVFFMVHFGLHQLFKSNKKYEFTQPFSKMIIQLMALIGLIHLILLLS